MADYKISVAVDSQGAEAGSRRVNRALKGTEQQARQADRRVDALNGTMRRLGSVAKTVGAGLVAYFSVRAITNFTQTAISEFSDLETTLWRIEKQAEQMGHAWAETK